MTYEEHITAAKTFLLAEELLIGSGMDMIAAEAVWGAAIQVIDATNHKLGTRHINSNRRRGQIIERWQSRFGSEGLNAGFASVKDHLHNHFYTGRLSVQDLSLHLVTGKAFVNRMIELTEIESAGC